ncbi:MAG TPA: nuclear transport factor 2 family protein [Chitinophagaceae bacterium]|nr:nuclear transport factor 2 family protein [Chitinophagaceae bacterium]HPH32720.1 nuclear transport factor 2 family protein [Chitinophagaceae bacterium]
MKILIITICLFFCGKFSTAQHSEMESEINKLEQEEVQAVMNKDTIALKKLWDKDYVVHNPENKIVVAKINPLDRPVLQNQRTSFTRMVEKIILNNNIAISMGRETVVSFNEASKSEQITERRYTNIWMKKDGLWKLTARHANKICGEVVSR